MIPMTSLRVLMGSPCAHCRAGCGSVTSILFVVGDVISIALDQGFPRTGNFDPLRDEPAPAYAGTRRDADEGAWPAGNHQAHVIRIADDRHGVHRVERHSARLHQALARVVEVAMAI